MSQLADILEFLHYSVLGELEIQEFFARTDNLIAVSKRDILECSALGILTPLPNYWRFAEKCVREKREGVADGWKGLKVR